MEPLSAREILEGLDTQYMGRNLVYLPQAGSTNEEARRLAESGAPEGTLVVADYQVAGRGRFERRWFAPPGSSLLMSLLFRPDVALAPVPQLTMVCGLAALDAVESETGLRAGLKWPNDIVLEGAKLGGILAEGGVTGDRFDYVVTGVGLNVNLEPGQLPGDLFMPVTSLSDALGRRVARLPLLWAFLRAVEERYEELKSGGSLHGEWARRLITLGCPVTVSTAETEVRGLAEGVALDGALLVRLDSGELRRVLAGDVTLRAQSLDTCA